MSFETEFADEMAGLTVTLHADNEVESHNENWLVSYADMMTLLFGFFAMLYLMGGKIEAANPPPPPPPPAAAVQKSAAPSPPVANVQKITSPAPSQAAKQEDSEGGNRGWNLLNWIPKELLELFALVAVVYFFSYRLGERRRRLELLYPREARIALPRVRPAAEPGAEHSPPQELFVDDAELELEESNSSVGVTLTDERWLISYADMMTLLFGFFAMLYLMEPNFDAVRKTMDQAFTKERESMLTLAERTQLPTEIDNETLRYILNPPQIAIAPTPEVSPVPPPAAKPAETPPPVAAAPTAPAAPNMPRTMTQKELEEREANQWKALRERLAKSAGTGVGQGENTVAAPAEGKAGAGHGGGGLGGGQGDKVGEGTLDGEGATICDSTASMAYRETCGGSGFFGCVAPEDLSATGGTNGDGGAVEFYCVGGKTRVCLTWERCPWRGQSERELKFESMACSPFGLGSGHFADCRNGTSCGFSSLECDANGQLTVRQ